MNTPPSNEHGFLVIRALATENECEVIIYGDPVGLRSLARRLLDIADLRQESLPTVQLPPGVGFHEHLMPGYQICGESDPAIIGRLDGRSTGDFSWLLLPDRAGGIETVKALDYPEIK